MKSLDSSKVKVDYYWTPFQLNPSLPDKSVSKEEHYQRKFGSSTRMDQIRQRLKSAGAERGVEFNFDGDIGNSFQSHRLVEWSRQFGTEKHNQLMERVFEAFFKENVDISDKSVLAKCATDVGLEGAAEFLGGDDLTEKVKRSFTEAHDRRISGVPYFVVRSGSKQHATSGAQPPEYFRALFDHFQLPVNDDDD